MPPGKIIVGAGGWHELHNGLADYNKKFNFVEINSTFYRIFHPTALELWRRSVPDHFEFSIKCYSALTHNIGPRPTEDAFRVFDLMVRYCSILHANVMVLESPAYTKPDGGFVEQARSFFNSALSRNKGPRIAWEFRRKTTEVPNRVISFLRDSNMIHVVDLTFEDPRYDTDILYIPGYSGVQQRRIFLIPTT